MPTNFHQKLIDLLKTDDRLRDEDGELITAAIHCRARQLDHDLIRRLLSDDEIKSKFFEEIDGRWIFNANAFTNYLSSKNFLANSYTRVRNKIGLNIGDRFLRERSEVSLAWPYKRLRPGKRTDKRGNTTLRRLVEANHDYERLILRHHMEDFLWCLITVELAPRLPLVRLCTFM